MNAKSLAALTLAVFLLFASMFSVSGCGKGGADKNTGLGAAVENNGNGGDTGSAPVAGGSETAGSGESAGSGGQTTAGASEDALASSTPDNAAGTPATGPSGGASSSPSGGAPDPVVSVPPGQSGSNDDDEQPDAATIGDSESTGENIEPEYSGGPPQSDLQPGESPSGSPSSSPAPDASGVEPASPSASEPASSSSDPQPGSSPSDPQPGSTPSGSAEPDSTVPPAPGPSSQPPGESAQEAIIGLWKPAALDLTSGTEQENAAASMLADSLCVFSADGSFRLILPKSFLDMIQDSNDSEAIFNITNGTWEKAGVDPDGNPVYSLSIPALAGFGYGAAELKVIDGFIVFSGYDGIKLARFE